MNCSRSNCIKTAKWVVSSNRVTYSYLACDKHRPTDTQDGDLDIQSFASLLESPIG